MGRPGLTYRTGLPTLVSVVLLLMAPVAILPSASAAAGDLLAPVFSDGDWWNYTVTDTHPILTKGGTVAVGLTEANGWLRYEISGTSSRLGQVSWLVAISGRLHLSGDFGSGADVGSASLEAQVAGYEWWAIDDLALLGSSVSYTGELDVATRSGSNVYDVVVYENLTLDGPLRLLLFPVPFAQFPSEDHNVTLDYEFRTGGYTAELLQAWSYTSTYEGLKDVQGTYISYNDQHTFSIEGSRVTDEVTTPIDVQVYYDQTPRKAVSVNKLMGREVSTYAVDASVRKNDLILASQEFVASELSPAETRNVTFQGIVHNLGVSEALSIEVELWGGLVDDLPRRLNKTTLQRIKANDQAELSYVWKAEQVGSWEFTLRVDPYNTLIEDREDNNEVMLRLEVVPLVPRPNLFVGEDDLVLDPQSPLQNRTAVQVSVIVGNDGLGMAENVTVNFYLGKPGAGGVPIGWREKIDFIPPGGSRSAWITWTANVPGHHQIWAYLDQNNSVNETDETDNIVYVPLVVIASPSGGVDLVVSSVKLLDSEGRETSKVSRGETVTVRTIISNIERVINATRVHVSFYVDVEDPAGVIGFTEGRVDANSFSTFSIKWSVNVDDGPHQLIVITIAIGEIEATLLNNEDTLEFSVGPKVQPNPEPLVVTLYPEVILVDPGELLEVSGKVTVERTGYELPGATVIVSFLGESNTVSTTTNELGRYLLEIEAPTKPGTYRLQVVASRALSEGSAGTTIVVKNVNDGNGDNGGGEDDANRMLYFLVTIVIVLAVGVPLTYYLLLSQVAQKRRIRRVHEEIVEIVDKE